MTRVPCDAKRYNDEMVCATCNLSWGINDPDAPFCNRPFPRRPKLLIVGHGRHGKDTVAEMLTGFGLRFVSSSRFAAAKAVFPIMSGLYSTVQACYDDRANHRELWFHAIRAYNLRPGPSLAEQILVDHDIYVGMRSIEELKKSRHLFDEVIWVDRSHVLPPEPGASNEITETDASIVIDNNGSLSDLRLRVTRLVDHLMAAR